MMDVAVVCGCGGCLLLDEGAAFFCSRLRFFFSLRLLVGVHFGGTTLVVGVIGGTGVFCSEYDQSFPCSS